MNKCGTGTSIHDIRAWNTTIHDVNTTFPPSNSVNTLLPGVGQVCFINTPNACINAAFHVGNHQHLACRGLGNGKSQKGTKPHKDEVSMPTKRYMLYKSSSNADPVNLYQQIGQVIHAATSNCFFCSLSLSLSCPDVPTEGAQAQTSVWKQIQPEFSISSHRSSMEEILQTRDLDSIALNGAGSEFQEKVPSTSKKCTEHRQWEVP